MTNQDIARIFLHISEILDIQGENAFKVRSYVRAAQTVEGLTYDLYSLKGTGDLPKLPGIGEGIAKKLMELIDTGRLQY